MNNNKSDFEKILNLGGGKINRNILNNAAETGDATPLINSLSEKDRRKLNNILDNKEELEKILKSPQAQTIFKLFGKGGKNG